MLVIPITGNADWRRPPVVTLVLILINCLVYFMFQTDEDRDLEAAFDYYFSSGLAAIELPLYRDYLKSMEDATDLPDINGNDDLKEDENAWHLFFRLEHDSAFQAQLHAGEIVTPDDPIYENWQTHRDAYQALKADVFTYKFGFIPARASLTTALTSMFLHGGLMHLIGNMVFLWIVGWVLERGCGWWFYLGTYLLTGVAAAAAHGMANINSLVPCIGASGAISGLMGAYAVCYGREKVKIFYSLGFYFGYLWMPGAILLLVWVLKEAAFMVLDETSNVAYMAHLGGLVAGALVAWPFKRWVGIADGAVFRAAPPDEIPQLLERIKKCAGELDLDQGRALVEQARKLAPERIDILQQWFDLEKLDPHNDQVHSAAKRLITQLLLKPETHSAAAATYGEYLELVKTPKLSTTTYLGLSRALIKAEKLTQAEKIIAFLLKQAPHLPDLPTALANLAEGYGRKGNASRRQRCLAVLQKSFPDSPEARHAVL